MKQNIKLVAERYEGLNEWSGQLKKYLDFSEAAVSVPDGKDVDLFKGHISIDELNSGVLKAVVASTAQRVKLVHADIPNQRKNKIFIITSCNGMIFYAKGNRENISVGDSIIIPSWIPFTEECDSNRKSASVLLDISSISDEDSRDELDRILWRKASDLYYGTELNKLMMNYLSCYNNKFCERNTQALLSLLALELEHSKKADFFQPRNENNKLELIINYI
ncbi:TPA: AraC family transcriptional regulator, partial [Escherichia coli]|nr:AraC family transcriptional regulator [Escherichia coli]